ncbi:hypothetical protein [Streptomyces cadmiisoli]|uniref:hypothetical protein n=1 Tax=Streptomyces cadmiisoli TaxID=2184053 RepID=UPI003D70AA29
MNSSDTVVRGTPVGRRQEWVPATTLAVPTVWLATADGLVLLDLVAIELAINGLRTRDWSLTGPEIAYAADFLLQRGTDRTQIAKLVGSDYRTIRSWFPTNDTTLSEALTRVRTPAEHNRRLRERRSAEHPPARCGTYKGAKRHQRRKEPLDEACQLALRAADRHYRAHGTYAGCPEFPA